MVEVANSALGVNVALVEVVETLPVTPPETVMLVVVSVDVFIASLNTTVIALLTPTPVALTAGETKLEAKLVRGKLHELGRLPIPAGLQTLTFTLQDPVTGPQPGITKLWNIVLEPYQP